MTKEILAMAREARFVTAPPFHDKYWNCMTEDLERFATLVGNAKLEEAAKTCEAQLETGAHIRCAQAIRKLKEPTT